MLKLSQNDLELMEIYFFLIVCIQQATKLSTQVTHQQLICPVHHKYFPIFFDVMTTV